MSIQRAINPSRMEIKFTGLQNELTIQSKGEEEYRVKKDTETRTDIAVMMDSHNCSVMTEVSSARTLNKLACRAQLCT